MDMVCKQIGIYSAPKKNIENNNDRSAWILKILKTPKCNHSYGRGVAITLLRARNLLNK